MSVSGFLVPSGTAHLIRIEGEERELVGWSVEGDASIYVTLNQEGQFSIVQREIVSFDELLFPELTTSSQQTEPFSEEACQAVGVSSCLVLTGYIAAIPPYGTIISPGVYLLCKRYSNIVCECLRDNDFINEPDPARVADKLLEFVKCCCKRLPWWIKTNPTVGAMCLLVNL